MLESVYDVGTVHVPTDEVASALSSSSRQWKERYRCDKPGHGEAVIMQCRTNRRAAWAAQIAQDAGLTNCFVYKQVGHLQGLLANMYPCSLSSRRSESESLSMDVIGLCLRCTIYLVFASHQGGLSG